MPAASLGLGPIDLVALHPGFQNAHELATSVPEFLHAAANRNNVSPLIGVEVVLRRSPPNGISSGKDQHRMRMTLVSGARETPECFFVGSRAPGTRRVKRAKIELGIAVSGLCALRIAIGHLPVGHRICGPDNGVRHESRTAKDC